jgi:hypothetical protein
MLLVNLMPGFILLGIAVLFRMCFEWLRVSKTSRDTIL